MHNCGDTTVINYNFGSPILNWGGRGTALNRKLLGTLGYHNASLWTHNPPPPPAHHGPCRPSAHHRPHMAPPPPAHRGPHMPHGHVGCNNGGTNMYDVMVAREQRKAVEDSNEKGLWATIANGVGNFFSSGCGLGSILNA